MTRIAALAVLTVAALACTAPAPDPNACQIGYGFGSYGCAEVAGSVLNAANQAMANVNISSGISTDPFDLAQTTTGANGAFRLRLERRWPSRTASSDTASAWVHARVPAPPAPATAHDSIMVLIHFYPIGSPPVATAVTIHLP